MGLLYCFKFYERVVSRFDLQYVRCIFKNLFQFVTYISIQFYGKYHLRSVYFTHIRPKIKTNQKKNVSFENKKRYSFK